MRIPTAMCVPMLAALAVAQEAALGGRVLDGSGPVEGVAVATMWAKDSPLRGVRTGEQGRFELPAQAYLRPVALLAMDAARQRGAVVVVAPEDVGGEQELHLEPLTRVNGRFTCQDLGLTPAWTNVYVNVLPGRIRVAQFDSREARFSFLLPPGDYELDMYGTDSDTRRQEVSLGGEGGELDLGEIDLPATKIALMYGSEPPRWNVTEARGAEQELQLADLRGKHVLIEFWGFW